MGRLNNISGKRAVKVFLKAGWNIAGQVGSHVVMTKKANLTSNQLKLLRNVVKEYLS